MDIYDLEKLTGWTPELSPPPDSPFYKWRQLAEGEPVGGTLPSRVHFNGSESELWPHLVERGYDFMSFPKTGTQFCGIRDIASLVVAVSLAQQVFHKVAERGPRQRGERQSAG